MHLTDQQLHEVSLRQVNFNEIKHFDRRFDDANSIDVSDKYAVIKAHFSMCEICQRRLINLQQFRKQLAQDTEAYLPNMQWQKIESEIDAISNRTQLLMLNKKVKGLQKALIAMAASVLILLIYPNIINVSTNELDLKLAEVINENNELQTQFSEFRRTNYTQIVAHQTTQFRLQQIDQEIQLAYLNKMSTEQKIQLWDERKKLLIQSFNDVQKRTVFTI